MVIERYRYLIQDEVRADEKKLYSYEAFIASLEPVDGEVQMRVSGGRGVEPSIAQFVAARRRSFENEPLLSPPGLRFLRVGASPTAAAADATVVTATIESDSNADALYLYYRSGGSVAFEKTRMALSLATYEYTAELPRFSDGTLVQYYIKAVISESVSVFYPEKADSAPFGYTRVLDFRRAANPFFWWTRVKTATES